MRGVGFFYVFIKERIACFLNWCHRQPFEWLLKSEVDLFNDRLINSAVPIDWKHESMSSHCYAVITRIHTRGSQCDQNSHVPLFCTWAVLRVDRCNALTPCQSISNFGEAGASVPRGWMGVQLFNHWVVLKPDNRISVDMYTRTTTTNMTVDQNDPKGGGDGLGSHNRRKQGRPSRIETSVKGGEWDAFVKCFSLLLRSSIPWIQLDS